MIHPRLICGILTLLASGQIRAWPKSATPCFDYEPSAVAVTGVVVQRTYPGLPNFESIKEGDRPETSWLLVLARPICVDGKSGDLVNVAQTNVREIQLVFENHESYQSYRRLLRRRAIVTGELLGAITGHDHTEVLLIVSSIRSEKDDVWHLNFSNSRRRSPLTPQQFSHIHTEGAENARKAAAYIAEHGPTNKAIAYIITNGEEPTPAQVRRLGDVHFVQRVGHVFLYEPGPGPKRPKEPKH